MTDRAFIAVDLGATSGRVVVGTIEDGRDVERDSPIELHEMHRFTTGVHLDDGHLRWRIRTLFDEVLVGIASAAEQFPNIESIGIDSWAVDYALLDASGALLADPISYRDERTADVVHDVHLRIDRRELYAITGIQFLPFNTIYQLAAERRATVWPSVATVVLLPDLIAYWLTGALATEATNASTTGLVDATSGDWSPAILDRLGLDASILPPIRSAGTTLGTVRPELCSRLGLRPTTIVTSVGSHDTASAVVAVPAAGPDFAYISSGTWSLVGLELDSPVTSDQARAANFSNEAGVDGRVRFLRNVGGLWLLEESIRWWTQSGDAVDRADLLGTAAGLPTGGPTIDVEAPEFVAPGDMPARIRAAAGDRAGELSTRASLVRCILDSLASAYATAIGVACDLTGRSVGVVHIVGGGSQNEVLCQLTAAHTRLPVVAGPVEATALGNVIVQARACGALAGPLEAIRTDLAGRPDLRRYTPG